jgi:two-component system sensor histidine kinase MprB
VTRRVAITGVLAVCLTALVVGVVAYVLVARDARNFENRVLTNLAAHPRQTLESKTTYTQLAQVTNARGVVVKETQALRALGQLPALSRGYADVTLKQHHLRVLTRKFGKRRSVTVSVAVSDAPARSSLARLRRGVLIAMVTGALLASLLLIWITQRALAPVRDTAALADRIVSTGDLTARVPDPVGSDEIAQLSHSINRMLDHLEHSDAALRRLVADASHELRSPVTTLRGNLELLSTGRLSEADRADALEDTRAEADRLGRLVEELLTLARADTVTPNQRVDLLELVSEATDGTGATLAGSASGSDPLFIQGDPVALRAMIRNLAENARRYAGGAAVEVELDGPWVILTVTDHGPGIAPQEREAIFGRFSRGTASAGLPGSGLGLAIVASTARSHGGSVSVEETPGGGATFRVRLPRAVPAQRRSVG